MPAFDVTYVMGTTGEHETGGLEFQGVRERATVTASDRLEAYAAVHGHFSGAGCDVVVADRGPAGPPLEFTPGEVAELERAGIPVEGGRLPRLGVTGVQIERIEQRVNDGAHDRGAHNYGARQHGAGDTEPPR